MIILFGSNVFDLFFHMADFPEKDQAVHLSKHVERPGGKGANQAVAAARAGSDVRFFGALGQDGYGQIMSKNLSDEGIDISGIDIIEDQASGLATIFVDENDGTHRVVVSQGANQSAKQEHIPDDILNDQTTLLLQRELPITEIETFIKRAKLKGAQTIMNLAPAKEVSEGLLHNLDYIILNEYEAETLAEFIGMSADDKWEFARDLYNKYKITTIITLGAAGSICYDGKNEYEINTLCINAVDTIGAGDAFSGYFAAAIDQNKPIKDALGIAAVASCLACTKIGAMTALPTKFEVENLLPEITIKENITNKAA